MDSSYKFMLIDNSNELTYQRTYKVHSRNDKGNVLVSSDLVNENFPYTLSKNSIRDSLVYFNGYDIEEHFTYALNSVENLWILNKYELFEQPNVPIERFNKGFVNNIQQYLNGGRIQYENDNGLISILRKDDFIPETDSWQQKTRIDFFYDPRGNDTLQMTYEWNNDVWKNKYKLNQSYINDLKVFYHYQFYDDQNNSWTSYSKASYNYNHIGQLDTANFKYWNIQDNMWHYYLKLIFTYHNNNLINQLNIRFNSTTQQMEKHKNYHVEYLDGSRIETFQNWDLVTEQWQNQHRYIYSYNVDEFIDTICMDVWNFFTEEWETYRQVSNTFDDNKNIIINEIYHRESDSLILNSRTYYYWNPFKPSSVPDKLLDKSISAYPNPASAYINFKFNHLPQNNSKLHIYNIAGQKIDEITLSKEGTIWDCSGIMPGVYIYSVICDGDKSTGKIVVK